ncbi:MAG TPA: hypothetical protein VKM54_22370 [Myxococcota bacterium]|nr:hypothetical protein [Myxococcota bacterium]
MKRPSLTASVVILTLGLGAGFVLRELARGRDGPPVGVKTPPQTPEKKASLNSFNAEKKAQEAKDAADPQREAKFLAGVVFGQNVELCYLQTGEGAFIAKDHWACANREEKKAGRREWPPIWSANYKDDFNFVRGTTFGMAMMLCQIDSGISTPYAPEALWACANREEQKKGNPEWPPPPSWGDAITQYHSHLNAAALKLATDLRAMRRKAAGFVDRGTVVCWTSRPGHDGRPVCNFEDRQTLGRPCPEGFNLNDSEDGGRTVHGLCWAWDE